MCQHRTVYAVRSLALVALLCLSPSGAAAAAVPDPCALLTTAHVRKVLDGTTRRKASTDRSTRVCTWYGRASSLHPRRWLTLRVTPYPGSVKTVVPSFDSVRVQGLGELAWYETLFVWRGHLMLTFYGQLRGDYTTLTETAALALRRLRRPGRLVLVVVVLVGEER